MLFVTRGSFDSHRTNAMPRPSNNESPSYSDQFPNEHWFLHTFPQCFPSVYYPNQTVNRLQIRLGRYIVGEQLVSSMWTAFQTNEIHFDQTKGRFWSFPSAVYKTWRSLFFTRFRFTMTFLNFHKSSKNQNLKNLRDFSWRPETVNWSIKYKTRWCNLLLGN